MGYAGLLLSEHLLSIEVSVEKAPGRCWNGSNYYQSKRSLLCPFRKGLFHSL